MSEYLLRSLFEHIKSEKVQASDFDWIIDNIKHLSKWDEMLTLDEFDLIVKKPTTM